MKMKAANFLALPLFVLSGFSITPGLPAFPGAEGWGANSRGGRGPVVINSRTYVSRINHVTNLNTSGAGSFAAAVTGGLPKYVVFDVAGVIDLKQTNLFVGSRTTIAGQTSPGGITIVNGGLFTTAQPVHDSTLFTDAWVSTGDVIVRHIRGRSSAFHGGDDNLRIMDAHDFIVDHCSFMNCCDEVVDASYSYNITLSYTVVAESNIGCAGEVNSHGYLGSMTSRHSLIRTLMMHHTSRAPLLDNCYYGTGCVPRTAPYELVNNIFYNNHYSQTFEKENTAPINIIGNFTRTGPNRTYTVSMPWIWMASGTKMTAHVEKNYNASLTMVTQEQFLRYTPLWSDSIIQPTAFGPNFTTGQQAYYDVSRGVGAFPRDSADRRLVKEAQTGTGKWRTLSSVETSLQKFVPRDPFDLKPWARPRDTDNDAMPDYWETLHGLNPSDSSDFRTLMNGGYEAIEVYINELSDTLVAAGRWPVDVSAENGRAVCADRFVSILPNPMAGRGVFTVSNPRNKQASLRIMDLRGREVAELLSGDRFEGTRSVTWSPKRLAPGCYLACYQLGGRLFQKKILILE